MSASSFRSPARRDWLTRAPALAGENPSRVWGQTRMDSIWDLRSIYNEARLVKLAQDEWCELARDGDVSLGRYPDSPLRLEALVSQSLAFSPVSVRAGR